MQREDADNEEHGEEDGELEEEETEEDEEESASGRRAAILSNDKARGGCRNTPLLTTRTGFPTCRPLRSPRLQLPSPALETLAQAQTASTSRSTELSPSTLPGAGHY